MDNSVDLLKEMYFYSLFEKQVKRIFAKKSKQYVDISIVCKNRMLENFFNEQYHKYRSVNTMHSYHDIINECIFWSYKAIVSFEIKGKGSWEGMINGTDKKNIGKILTAIKKTVKYELIRFINDNMKFTTAKIDGKNQHVRVKFELSSLDEILVGIDGNETDRISITSSDDNFWTVKQNYHLDFFYKWFHSRKKDILKKSQYDLLEKLAKCQHEDDKYTVDDCEAVLGIPRFKANQRLKDLKNRVLLAWEVENPMGFKSNLQMEKENEIKLWNRLIDIVYSDKIECSEQNKTISDWIVKHLENEIVSNLIYDNFIGGDCEKITSAFMGNGAIPCKILYKIIQLVENRLDKLQLFDTKTTKFFKKEHEMGRWTKEAHNSYKKYKKHFKQQHCETLDSDGTSIKKEEWQPFKESESIILTVLPTGYIDISNRMKVDL